MGSTFPRLSFSLPFLWNSSYVETTNALRNVRLAFHTLTGRRPPPKLCEEGAVGLGCWKQVIHVYSNHYRSYKGTPGSIIGFKKSRIGSKIFYILVLFLHILIWSKKLLNNKKFFNWSFLHYHLPILDSKINFDDQYTVHRYKLSVYIESTRWNEKRE